MLFGILILKILLQICVELHTLVCSAKRIKLVSTWTEKAKVCVLNTYMIQTDDVLPSWFFFICGYVHAAPNSPASLGSVSTSGGLCPIERRCPVTAGFYFDRLSGWHLPPFSWSLLINFIFPTNLLKHSILLQWYKRDAWCEIFCNEHLLALDIYLFAYDLQIYSVSLLQAPLYYRHLIFNLYVP